MDNCDCADVFSLAFIFLYIDCGVMPSFCVDILQRFKVKDNGIVKGTLFCTLLFHVVSVFGFLKYREHLAIHTHYTKACIPYADYISYSHYLFTFHFILSQCTYKMALLLPLVCLSYLFVHVLLRHHSLVFSLLFILFF